MERNQNHWSLVSVQQYSSDHLLPNQCCANFQHTWPVGYACICACSYIYCNVVWYPFPYINSMLYIIADLERCPKSICVYKRKRAGVLWIECDSYHQWFHIRWVKLTKKDAGSMTQWSCVNLTVPIIKNCPCNNFIINMIMYYSLLFADLPQSFMYTNNLFHWFYHNTVMIIYIL